MNEMISPCPAYIRITTAAGTNLATVQGWSAGSTFL